MIVETRGDVLKLRGVLNKDHWLTVKAALTLLLRDHPVGVIVDCNDLLECTGKGILTFREAARFTGERRGKIVFTGLSLELKEQLLKDTLLRSGLLVAPTVEEARSAFQEGRAFHPLAGPKGVCMVALTDETLSPLLLDQIPKLARIGGSQVYLAFFLVVPPALPMDAPMAAQEERIKNLLDQLQGAIVKEKVQVSSGIIRARRVDVEFSRETRRLNPSLLLIPVLSDISETALAMVRFALALEKTEVVLMSPGH